MSHKKLSALESGVFKNNVQELQILFSLDWFSFLGTAELIPQKIVCGVCGAERYYRHLKQARKFGVYSCETCRKFITKTISQDSLQSFSCLNGSGKYNK